MSSSATQTETQQFHAEVKQNLRRNYLANTVEGGIYIGGMAFLSAETVMPKMIESLGGADWLIALMPMMTRLGFMAPPLFTAHFVERLRRLKPFVTFMSFFQRLPYLVAGLMLVFMSDSHPRLVLLGVAAAPFVSGVFGGVSIGAWMEMVARIIPENRRASSWAGRNVIKAVIGIFAGITIKVLLEKYPGSFGYALLHFIATAFLFVSFFVFIQIREPNGSPVKKQKRRTLRENLASLPGVIRTDAIFRNFTLTRITGLSIFIMLPFLSIYACDVTGNDNSFIGTLVAGQMAGAILGNVMSGYIGDKHGGKLSMMVARIVYIAALVVAMFNTSAIGFIAIYVIHGACFSMDHVGSNTLSFEAFPIERRPTYLSLLMFIMFPSMIATSLICTGVRRYSSLVLPESVDNFTPAVVIAILGMALSMHFLSRVPEPRKHSVA